jgi:hypothetical protein
VTVEDNHDKHEAAYEAMCEALHAAEDVMGLMDRHWGDSGTDLDMIASWHDTLEAVAREIKREIGEPRVRLPDGGLVPRPKNT